MAELPGNIGPGSDVNNSTPPSQAVASKYWNDRGLLKAKSSSRGLFNERKKCQVGLSVEFLVEQLTASIDSDGLHIFYLRHPSRQEHAHHVTAYIVLPANQTCTGQPPWPEDLRRSSINSGTIPHLCIC